MLHINTVEQTEPEYFRHFTSRRSRVQVVGADRSTKKVLEEALRIRDLSTFDYKWLVFDKYDNEDFNEAIHVSSNFASADFRKIKTYNFWKSESYRFRKLRVVRWCDILSSAVKLEKEKGCLSLKLLKV